MMLKIRLARYGRRKKPFYRVIVADSRSSRDGKFIENIGFYDPINKDHFSINQEKFGYWEKRGAQINKSIRKIMKLSNKNI